MKIITLTLSPALDKSTMVEKLEPESKLRCDTPKYEPGGGGINVARVLKRLEGEAMAVFTAGGHSGALLGDLLQEEKVAFYTIPTQTWTRENLTVFVKSTQRQYRFVMPAPTLEIEIYEEFLKYVNKAKPEWIVVSGNIPQGAPDDFFARLAELARLKNSKLIIDTSGPNLAEAVNHGVFMIKPNLRELSTLVGKDAITQKDQEQSALQLIESGKCEIVVVSLGARGAMLVSKAGIFYTTPPTVVVKSTVGAGDSMVAGMVWALCQGWAHEQVLKFGVACGTATTINEGTSLCQKEDIDSIFEVLKR